VRWYRIMSKEFGMGVEDQPIKAPDDLYLGFGWNA
jgi:hypothetical protein